MEWTYGFLWLRKLIGGSERHDLVVVELVVGLAHQVVARTQAHDQPSLLMERAFSRQHANRHGAARAVVRQSGIVRPAPGVLATPELLVTTPRLKMTRERLIQPASMGFPHVDYRIRAVALPLADDVHAGLAPQRAK